MQQQRVQQWDWAAMLGSSKVSSCRVRQQQAQLQVRAAKLVTAQARRRALAAHGVREFQSRSSDIVLSEGSEQPVVALNLLPGHANCCWCAVRVVK